jgi:DNA-directed RNA polymerase subunit RPC12/RpoP
MARGEIPVVCSSCGYRAMLPFAALSRDLYHCSGCGSRIELGELRNQKREDSNPRSRSKPKRRRPYRRR